MKSIIHPTPPRLYMQTASQAKAVVASCKDCSNAVISVNVAPQQKQQKQKKDNQIRCVTIGYGNQAVLTVTHASYHQNTETYKKIFQFRQVPDETHVIQKRDDYLIYFYTLTDKKTCLMVITPLNSNQEHIKMFMNRVAKIFIQKYDFANCVTILVEFKNDILKEIEISNKQGRSNKEILLAAFKCTRVSPQIYKSDGLQSINLEEQPHQ